MKTIIVLAVLTLAGCAAPGGGSYFDPEIVVANDRYVTIYDAVGSPGAAENMAERYCQSKGRHSQFQNMGGTHMLCSGRYRDLCTTYLCVQ